MVSFYLKAIKQLIKIAISEHPKKFFLLCWLIISMLASFSVGGMTQKSINKIFYEKHKPLSEVSALYFNKIKQAYLVCYFDSTNADYINLSSLEIKKERKKVGVIFTENSVISNGCDISDKENTEEIYKCDTKWSKTKHCFRQLEYFKIDIIKTDRIPEKIYYYSKPTSEVNFKEIYYLPVAVFVDMVIMPFSALWMLVIGVVSLGNI